MAAYEIKDYSSSDWTGVFVVLALMASRVIPKSSAKNSFFLFSFIMLPPVSYFYSCTSMVIIYSMSVWGMDCFTSLNFIPLDFMAMII